MKIGTRIEWSDGDRGVVIAVDKTSIPYSYRVRIIRSGLVCYVFEGDNYTILEDK